MIRLFPMIGIAIWGLAIGSMPYRACLQDSQLPVTVDQQAYQYLTQYPDDPLFQGYATDTTAGPPSPASEAAAYVYAPLNSPAWNEAATFLNVCH